MSDLVYIKNVGFLGCVSMLVASIVGPALYIMPKLFQAYGWILTLAALFFIALLAYITSLFMIEAASKFPGNQRFQRNIEYTVLVHQFYGKKWFYIAVSILYGSITSCIVISLVTSSQILDRLYVDVLGGTCGIGMFPSSNLYCTHSTSPTPSPFESDTMFITLGSFTNLALLVPFTYFELNVIVPMQLVSAAAIGLFTLITICTSISSGINTSRTFLKVPNLSNLFGTMFFSFAFSKEILTLVNIAHPKVDLKKCVGLSTCIACSIYVLIGVFGALGFDLDSSNTIVAAMYSSQHDNLIGIIVLEIMLVLIPLCTCIASILVNMSIIQLNLVTGQICSKPWARFWGVIVPLCIAVPLQSGIGVAHFRFWTNLTFQALCNYIVPFLIMMMLSKRSLVMNQSIMDDIEFLDITAGIKKMYRDDEDDFDYIYHLPYADLDRIVIRDPFKPSHPVHSKTKSIGNLSLTSRHSIKAIRSTLDVNVGKLSASYRAAIASHSSLNQSKSSLSDLTTGQTSSSNMVSDVVDINLKGTLSMMNSTLGLTMDMSRSSLKKSHLTAGGLLNPNQNAHIIRSKRVSVSSNETSSRQSKIGGNMANIDNGNSEYLGGLQYGNGELMDIFDDEYSRDEAIQMDTLAMVKPFKAMPRWLTNIMRPQWVAGLGACLVFGLTVHSLITAAIYQQTHSV
ncbi:hypothetical protein BDV3_006603 [Batrachochytrium dendrobatidis]